MSGAGEQVERLPDPAPFGLVIVPSRHTLSTPAVYAEFDRLGKARSAAELDRAAAAARAGEPPPPVNDLQAAARELCPRSTTRSRFERRGMVSGSGPTVFALFDSPPAARAAARGVPGAIAAEPVTAAFGQVRAA